MKSDALSNRVSSTNDQLSMSRLEPNLTRLNAPSGYTPYSHQGILFGRRLIVKAVIVKSSSANKTG